MKSFFTQTEIACFNRVNLTAQWPIVMLFTHLCFLLPSVLCNLDLQLISQLGVGRKRCKCYRLTWQNDLLEACICGMSPALLFGKPHAKPKRECQWQTCAQLFMKTQAQLNPSKVQGVCLPVVSHWFENTLICSVAFSGVTETFSHMEVTLASAASAVTSSSSLSLFPVPSHGQWMSGPQFARKDFSAFFENSEQFYLRPCVCFDFREDSLYFVLIWFT